MSFYAGSVIIGILSVMIFPHELIPAVVFIIIGVTAWWLAWKILT